MSSFITVSKVQGLTIDTWPYLETFDTTPSCGACDIGGLDTDCIQIQADLGWMQEDIQDTADTNWIVWTGNAPTAGTGPKTGDHTSGGGNWLWVHQGTGAVANGNDDDGAPYCEPEPTAFVGQTVGIVSPILDFSAVMPGDNIFLRFWYWMHGLRVGRLSVQLSTNGSISGPWTQNLTQIGLSDNSWEEAVVELVGMQGQASVRLRFLAEFLPTYCPSGVPGCVYGGTSPHPDDMADQAIDDVEIFLSSSAPSLTAGSEDRAIWVDLSTRYGLQNTAPFVSDQQGSWVNQPSSLGTHRMLTWGGMSATGEIISVARIFDYQTRSFVLALETGQVPLPRRRGAHVILGGANSSDTSRLAIYGGRGKFGITAEVLMLDPSDGSFEPSPGPLTCTDITPGEFSHLRFPAEGARASLSPFDPTLVYVTMGRSLVVQINFVTAFTIDPLTGACTGGVLRPSSGAIPPRPRWDHVMGAWSGPSNNNTYLFVWGGRFQPADTDEELMLADLRIFDTVAVEWMAALPVADPSQTPLARSGAAAVNNRLGDKLVLFGGQAMDGTVLSDVYVLQYDLQFQLWKRLAPGLDVANIPARAQHLMLPMFFSDTTLDPMAPNSENSEGFMIYGGVGQGGQVSNHMAKLHFGDLNLVALPTGSDDDDETPIIAIVLGVALPFCCLCLLLLAALTVVVGILVAWRVVSKRRLRRKYGIGQDLSKPPSPTNNKDYGWEDDDDGQAMDEFM